jgi:hypothetical protein
LFGVIIAAIAFVLSLQMNATLMSTAMRITVILIFGFYFTTLVRVIYFKINHFEANTKIVMYFSISELISATIAFLVTALPHYPLLSLIWIGFIAKPFMQLFILKKQYQEMNYKIAMQKEELA